MVTIEIPDRNDRLWTVRFTQVQDLSRVAGTVPMFAVRAVATAGEVSHTSLWGIDADFEVLWPGVTAPQNPTKMQDWYLPGIVRACRRSFDKILAHDGIYECVLGTEHKNFFVKPPTGDSIDLIEWGAEEILIDLTSIRDALETRAQQGGWPLEFDFSFPEGWKMHKILLRERRDAGDPLASAVYPLLNEFEREYTQLSALGVPLLDGSDREYAQLSALGVLQPRMVKQVLEQCGIVNMIGHLALRKIAAARSPQEETLAEPPRDEAWPQDRLVHIRELALKNLRCFQEQHLELMSPEDDHGQWLVLLGENGMGKTTMLRAIALALSRPEVAGAYLTRFSGDAPLIRNTSGSRERGEISVRLASESASIQIEPAPGIERLVVARSPALRPPVFAYGCRRGSALGGPDRESNPDPLRGADTLFDESASLIHADTWLGRCKLAANEDSSKRAFFEAVCRTLEAVLLDVDCISVEAEHTWVKGPKIGRVPLAGLSDGYLTTLGWVVDFIARWARYARDAGYTLGERFNESMPCVVLIDELDLHLHPRWQTEVISRLRCTFPRTTFVATTHNPLTLHNTKPGEVHVIRQADDGSLEIVQRDLPPGIRTDQVLTGEWFGLRSTLDQETIDLLDRHRELLRARRPEDDPERVKLERELRQRLGHYADTPAERLAQELVAEQFDEEQQPITDDDRATLRELYEQRVARAAHDAAKTSGNQGQ